MSAESLIEIATELTRIFVPIIIVLSFVSNSVNILILIRPNLNKHPASLYFLVLAVNNIFYSSCILMFNLLADGYQLDLVARSVVLCKIISFFLNFCPTTAVFLIVFASIDRFCASSSKVSVRQLSSLKNARRIICLVLIVLFIYYCGTLLIFELIDIGVTICTVSTEILFNTIYFISILVIYVIIAPLSMMIFGLLTIKNIRNTRLGIDRISRYRRTEGQLSRMLLLQVGTHILLTLPFCCLFFTLILPVPFRSTAMFVPTLILTKIPFYFSFTTAFFLYILSGHVYRNELYILFKLSRRQNRIRTSNHLDGSTAN